VELTTDYGGAVRERPLWKSPRARRLFRIAASVANGHFGMMMQRPPLHGIALQQSLAVVHA
jgi:hypothetical protein